MSPDPRAGFTLLELLVALGVFSLAALALVNLSAESAATQSRIETRTLGGIVADNLAVEAMIARGGPPLDDEGVSVLAGREWRWSRTTTATSDPSLHRVTLEVYAEGEVAAQRILHRGDR